MIHLTKEVLLSCANVGIFEPSRTRTRDRKVGGLVIYFLKNFFNESTYATPIDMLPWPSCVKLVFPAFRVLLPAAYWC